MFFKGSERGKLDFKIFHGVHNEGYVIFRLVEKTDKWYSQIYWDSTRNSFSPSRWWKRPTNAVVIHDIVSVSVSVSVVIIIVIVIVIVVVVAVAAAVVTSMIVIVIAVSDAAAA